MGSQALVAVICCLAVRVWSAEEEETALKTVVVPDSQSEETAASIFRSLPLAVYASAAPHAAYSFHAPAFTSPSTSSEVAFRNLKDSYGKFVQAPHSAAYKTAIPQQYIQLQELPAHLAQPLLARQSLHFKQAVPHFPGGESATFVNRHVNQNYGSQSLPFANNDKIRYFTPQKSRYEVYRNPSQQSKPVYNLQATYQRIQEKPQSQVTHQNIRDPVQSSSNEQNRDKNSQIQSAPAQTSVTAIVNGKKTVITLDTKPPLPLLDLNLLEPLKFNNPLVPQIQNYLPRINSATYHKLSDFNEAKQTPNNSGQKPLSDDSEIIIGKPKKSPKHKKYNKPSLQETPEITYEINKPGHRETYSEQVIKYNKETTSKPVIVSYHKSSHKEPVTYSFTHSAKEPLHIKHVEYDSDKDTNPPKELIYNIPPEEQKGFDHESSSTPPENENVHNTDNSSETHHEHDDGNHYSKEERNNEGSPRQTDHTNHHSHKESPAHHHQSYSHSQHHHQHNKESPSYFAHHNKPTSYDSQRNVLQPPHHNRHSYEPTTPSRHPSHKENHQGESPKQTNYQSSREAPPKNTNYDGSSQNKGHYDTLPSHLLPSEHRNAEPFLRPVRIQPILNLNPLHYTGFAPPQGPSNQFQPSYYDYSHELHLDSPQLEYAEIKVDPVQHIKTNALSPHVVHIPQSSTPQKPRSNNEYQNQDDAIRNGPSPHIHQKSKHVIIKEKEETPNEMHSLAEQLMEQMVEQEENSEDDFEKAYKQSAFGFPAYEQSIDVEKDIYNPESYGVPRYHSDYDIERTPFEQYTKEDEYPKSSRAEYKDARDNTQKNYFLDFSISKPESFTDRYKSKENYFKIYEKHRPEKFFGPEKDEKDNSREKMVLYHTKHTKPKQHFSFGGPKKHSYYMLPKQEQDSTPFSSQPYHKHKTFFVEPQFQYGFVPIAAPLTLDSELAAMATNDSPETESEKPGIRKKVYKENWYIKKISTSAAKPS